MKDDGEPDWEIVQVSSRFGRLIGPLSRRRHGDGWIYGMLAHEGLANEAGIVHGGAVMALFDEILGTIINEELGRAHVTVQHSTVFLDAVRLGEFIEVRHEIIKATRSMTFVEGRLSVGERLAAKADVVFKARRDPSV